MCALACPFGGFSYHPADLVPSVVVRWNPHARFGVCHPLAALRLEEGMWSAFLRAPSPSALEALADAVQVAEAVPIPPRAAFAPLLKALAAKSTHAAVVLRQVAEVADATHSRASAEPLRGCPGQPCALRTAPRLEFSTHMQYASTAFFCDLGPAGRRPPPPVRGGARGRAARAAGGDRGGRAQAARLDAQRGGPDGAQP
eukprot:scaffold71254_cov84-Phaeocystis_antarctica.AAC.2